MVSSSHTLMGVYSDEDIKRLLSEFHYFEKFDENKTYLDTEFFHSYGKGYRRYMYEKYSMNRGKDVYIVAQEILTKEDVDALLPYCQCRYHTMSFLNPAKYFTCPCCVGCISGFNPPQSIIDKTRQKYEKSKQFSS